MFNFRRIFNPTEEEKELDRKRIEGLLDALIREKSCTICKHRELIREYVLGGAWEPIISCNIDPSKSNIGCKEYEPDLEFIDSLRKH